MSRHSSCTFQIEFDARFSRLPTVLDEKSSESGRMKLVQQESIMERNELDAERRSEKAKEHERKRRGKKSIVTIEEKRRIANERERIRVHALSTAFNDLRRAIPSYSRNQRLSKLSILRVAINYIAALDVINRGIWKFDHAARFQQHVNQCTITLHAEYGKSGAQATAYPKRRCNRNRTRDKRHNISLPF